MADVYVRETAKQHTRNYTVPASSAATGMKLTQRETPQSLSVITEKQINDQSLDTLQEVLKQVPGVYHSKMGNNATGDSQFAARGGAIDSITVDGKSKFLYESKAIRRATNNLDSVLYEEVAVIRGASGLANGGWGEPSGTIALTRKKPHAKAQTTVEADIGSWQHYRLILDANAPLNAAKTLRGRAVVVSDHGGDYLPYTSRHNHTLYGILAYDPAPQTQISAGAEIHTDRNRGSSRFGFLTIAGDEYDGFKPFNADPRKNSSARWAYGRENSAELFASLRHEFGNGWTLKGDYSYTRSKSEMLSGIAGTYEIASDFSSVVSADFDKGRLKEHNFSLKLDGQYPLFGRNHDFAGGISYLNSKDIPSYYTEPEVPVPDLRLFDGNVAKPDIAYRRDGLEHSRNLSVFASTRFKLTGKWSLIAGGRWTDWKYRYITSRSRFVDTKRGKTIFVPYLAATYDFTPNLTAYASYTTVFRPQVRYLTASGDALDPLEGKTYEVGLKGAWFEGRLNAALSVYQNRRDNLGIYSRTPAQRRKLLPRHRPHQKHRRRNLPQRPPHRPLADQHLLRPLQNQRQPGQANQSLLPRAPVQTLHQLRPKRPPHPRRQPQLAERDHRRPQPPRSKRTRRHSRPYPARLRHRRSDGQIPRRQKHHRIALRRKHRQQILQNHARHPRLRHPAQLHPLAAAHLLNPRFENKKGRLKTGISVFRRPPA